METVQTGDLTKTEKLPVPVLTAELVSAPEQDLGQLKVPALGHDDKNSGEVSKLEDREIVTIILEKNGGQSVPAEEALDRLVGAKREFQLRLEGICDRILAEVPRGEVEEVVLPLAQDGVSIRWASIKSSLPKFFGRNL